MEIGEPIRTIIVEPVEDPFSPAKPDPEPEREVEVEPDRELIPA